MSPPARVQVFDRLRIGARLISESALHPVRYTQGVVGLEVERGRHSSEVVRVEPSSQVRALV